jgi:hypothetical protein
MLKGRRHIAFHGRKLRESYRTLPFASEMTAGVADELRTVEGVRVDQPYE